MAIPTSNNPLGWEASEFAEIWWQVSTTIDENAWINVKEQEPNFTNTRPSGTCRLKFLIHGIGEGSALRVDIMDNMFQLVMRTTYSASEEPQVYSMPLMEAGRYTIWCYGIDAGGVEVPGVEWMFPFISMYV